MSRRIPSSTLISPHLDFGCHSVRINLRSVFLPFPIWNFESPNFALQILPSGGERSSSITKRPTTSFFQISHVLGSRASVNNQESSFSSRRRRPVLGGALAAAFSILWLNSSLLESIWCSPCQCKSNCET